MQCCINKQGTQNQSNWKYVKPREGAMVPLPVKVKENSGFLAIYIQIKGPCDPGQNLKIRQQENLNVP